MFVRKSLFFPKKWFVSFLFFFFPKYLVSVSVHYKLKGEVAFWHTLFTLNVAVSPSEESWSNSFITVAATEISVSAKGWIFCLLTSNYFLENSLTYSVSYNFLFFWQLIEHWSDKQNLSWLFTIPEKQALHFLCCQRKDPMGCCYTETFFLF